MDENIVFDPSIWEKMVSPPVNEDEEDYSRFKCGEFHWHFDPLTGRNVKKPHFCRKYHTCPTCKAMKEKELYDRIKPLIDNPKIRLIVHNDCIANLNKTYDNRLHVPGEGGVYYSLVESDDLNVGKPLTEELAQIISAHAVTPSGKRISGKLGKISSGTGPNPEADGLIMEMPEEITRRAFKFQTLDGENFEDEVLISQIERITIQETIDLEPKTINQLQDAIYVREQKLVEVAGRYGLAILFLYIETRMVLESKIDWGQSKKWLNKQIN